MNFDDAIAAINSANNIVVVQAENPDADSLASALALEDILGNLGKKVSLYCAIDMPKYLRYLEGWDRVVNVINNDCDLVVVVDTNSQSLLEKTMQEYYSIFTSRPVVIIDHHSSEVNFNFKTINTIDENGISTGYVIAKLAKIAGWNLREVAANMIATSIMSDSLGLTSTKVSADSVRVLSEMIELGADLARLEENRREYGKKSFEIFKYKSQLMQRVELVLDGRVAMVHIPWEEIQKFSDQYNPSVLVIEEMRLIEGVKFAAAFKSYPDGKITAKLKANNDALFMDSLASNFGGGGHPFMAGFKVYDIELDQLKVELLHKASELLEPAQNE